MVGWFSPRLAVDTGAAFSRPDITGGLQFFEERSGVSEGLLQLTGASG